MTKKRLIPCLDIRGGQVVKGIHGSGLRDGYDPVEAARYYDGQGADELFLFDVSGSSEGHEQFAQVVRRVIEQTNLPVGVSGGVRREADVHQLFKLGADKVAIGSAGVLNPRLVRELVAVYGSAGLVGAVDVRPLPLLSGEQESAYEVAIQGGTRSTGLDALAWCQTLVKLGVGELLLTCVDRNGSRDGYDLEILQKVVAAVEVPVLVRGGVGSLQQLEEGLGQGGAQGALAASMFHFGLVTIHQAKQYLQNAGIAMRIE